MAVKLKAVRREKCFFFKAKQTKQSTSKLTKGCYYHCLLFNIITSALAITLLNLVKVQEILSVRKLKVVFKTVGTILSKSFCSQKKFSHYFEKNAKIVTLTYCFKQHWPCFLLVVHEFSLQNKQTTSQTLRPVIKTSKFARCLSKLWQPYSNLYNFHLLQGSCV